MSLLDAIRRQLLGQAAMMQPGQGMGGATQGLLGQGGQMGGGLLQSNLSQMNQGEGGLLSNIPQAALLGSAIYGQGIQGRDPFSALLPAVAQTAQLQKYLTPEVGKTKEVYDKELQKNVFATERQIQSQPERFIPEPKEPESLKTIRSQENTLSKNYMGSDVVKQFNESTTSVKKLFSGLEANSGAGDVASIFTFMKTLDPESVVREGEFATAENTTGVFKKYWNSYNRLVKGERLTDSQREDFKKLGINLYKQNQQSLDNFKIGFNRIAENQSLNTENIFLDADLRPQSGSINIPIDPNNPESGTKEIKFNSSLGMQLVDYKDGEYYFRLTNGELFKTKGIR
jgi:hypothetical protein